jgi:hypothetical protein
MRWAEHVVQMGKNRNAYRIFVEKPEGKRHWEEQDNIITDLREG